MHLHLHGEAAPKPTQSSAYPPAKPARRRRTTSPTEVSTLWLFILLAYVHYADVLFQNRWGAFTSLLGMGMAVLTWAQRGRLFSIRWFICLWGAAEGLEIFVCQGLYTFFPKDGPMGQCSAYINLPLYEWGLITVAVLTYWVVKGRS